MLRRALNARLAIQAMIIKVSANLVVQLVRHWSSPTAQAFDLQQVFEFAVYGLLGSQAGNIMQFLLEDVFPTRHVPVGAVLPDTLGQSRPLEEEKIKFKEDDALPPHSAVKKRWYSIGSDVSWLNVLVKLILDQTFGLFISGCIFLICTNIARVSHPALITDVIGSKILPLMEAGWHIWPLVAICNFLWVPVRSRVLVAVCVGFGWSIFLSIFASRK